MDVPSGVGERRASVQAAGLNPSGTSLDAELVFVPEFLKLRQVRSTGGLNDRVLELAAVLNYDLQIFP